MKDNMNQDELEFVVFCFENVGLKLGIRGDKVYELLSKQSNILKEYILPNYEMLHTQSKEYIVTDIIECIRRSVKGYLICTAEVMNIWQRN